VRWFQCFLPSNLHLSAAVQMLTAVQMTTPLFLTLVLTNLSKSTNFNISTQDMPFLPDHRKVFFHEVLVVMFIVHCSGVLPTAVSFSMCLADSTGFFCPTELLLMCAGTKF